MSEAATSSWVKAFLLLLEKHHDLVTVLALVPAALFAVYTYWKSKKSEAAGRLQELFNRFYLDAELRPLRLNLDFNFDDTLRALIERMVKDEKSPFSTEEKQTLCQLDTLLKCLEFVLHLKKQGHISRDDCDAIFKYWFELLEKPDRECLREYIRKFGFKAVARQIATDMHPSIKHGSGTTTTPASSSPGPGNPPSSP
jgi:hypothetical protein